MPFATSRPPVDPTVAPDVVRVFGPDGEVAVSPQGDGVWSGAGVGVLTSQHAGRLAVRLVADVPVLRLQLRWRGGFAAGTRYLGDQWERAYGDLAWRVEQPERLMPWAFVAYHAGTDRADGVGVATGAGGLCAWTADGAGVSLWADLRSGSEPVRLGGRELAVADVVRVVGEPGERAFAVQQRLYRALCSAPRRPDHVVYGHNDWYIGYGDTSRDLVRRATARLVDLAADALTADPRARPYSVIDDGWSRGGLGHGPWLGNERFGDMGVLARRSSTSGRVPASGTGRSPRCPTARTRGGSRTAASTRAVRRCSRSCARTCGDWWAGATNW